MASFLGMVATKHFPWLLHSSDGSFPECYKNLQLPRRLWVGASRPPLLSFFQDTLSQVRVSAARRPLSHTLCGAAVEEFGDQEGEGVWTHAHASPGSEGGHPPAMGMLWGHSADTTLSLGLGAPFSVLWKLGRDLGAGMCDGGWWKAPPCCHSGKAQSLALSCSSSDFPLGHIYFLASRLYMCELWGARGGEGKTYRRVAPDLKFSQWKKE